MRPLNLRAGGLSLQLTPRDQTLVLPAHPTHCRIQGPQVHRLASTQTYLQACRAGRAGGRVSTVAGS